MPEFIRLTDDQIRRLTPAQRLMYGRYLQREYWRRNPEMWVKQRLKGWPWSKQIVVLNSIRDNKQTVVPAGFDLGKSYIAAAVCLWWVDTHDIGEVYVLTTAPTRDQVRAILWAELNSGHRRAKLAGKINGVRWKINGVDVGEGRKPADHSTASFQGLHRTGGVLVVLDEAAGIVEGFWDGAKGITANRSSRILAIGNPEAEASPFGEACKAGSGWEVIPISAHDSPNITGEIDDIPEPFKSIIRESLVDNEWIDARRNDWGEGSIKWMTKVEAKFVRDTKDVTVPYEWASRCTHRDGDIPTDAGPVELGVDVGGGGDGSVIRERRGPHAARVWRSCHDDPALLVVEILNAQAETKATSIKIDESGIGWGIVGWVESGIEERNELERQEAAKENRAPELIECEVHGVNSGEGSDDPKSFLNRRAQIWWEIGRELSRTGGWDLTDIAADSDDPTIEQLCDVKYRERVSGQIQIEAKDDYRKRNKGKSPDDADAVLLAYYVPPPSGPIFLGSV